MCPVVRTQTPNPDNERTNPITAPNWLRAEFKRADLSASRYREIHLDCSFTQLNEILES